MEQKNNILDLSNSRTEAIARYADKKSTLFVTDKGILVGVIALKEITDLIENETKNISDVMNRNFKYIKYNELYDGIMNTDFFSFIPIVNDNMKLLYVLNRKTLGKVDEFIESQKFEIVYWKEISENKQFWEKCNENTDLESTLYYQDFGDYYNVIENSVYKKTCLEIGAGPWGGITVALPDIEKRIIIEPLAEKYFELLKQTSSNTEKFKNIEYYSTQGENFIPELEQKIDGSIFCQNCLDHTPEWYFLLSNLASYAVKGCKFVLWTDIDHLCANPVGHYNITWNPENLFRLIENLGFKIEMKNIGIGSTNTYTHVSVLAEKI
ncbi:MAG: hypothetical protein LBM93_05075 [Oscillospiraceae bacterium]|jgi:hypothetical protein|nr:hypothetical protein [Oscillospiraceae bacterium]